MTAGRPSLLNTRFIRQVFTQPQRRSSTLSGGTTPKPNGSDRHSSAPHYMGPASAPESNATLRRVRHSTQRTCETLRLP